MGINRKKIEFLMSYREAVRHRNAVSDELEKLRQSKIMPAANIDGMPRGKGGGTDLSGYAAEVDGLLSEYKKADSNVRRAKKAITAAIMKLKKEPERLILRYRYINLQQTDYERRRKKPGTRVYSWNEIAEATDYEESTVKNLHGAALKKLKTPEKK